MTTRHTASELAREWREERIEFDDALVRHLVENLGLVPDPPLVVGSGMAISWVNMGLSDVVLDLPGYPQMTAADVIKTFDLEAFLESAL